MLILGGPCVIPHPYIYENRPNFQALIKTCLLSSWEFPQVTTLLYLIKDFPTVRFIKYNQMVPTSSLIFLYYPIEV